MKDIVKKRSYRSLDTSSQLIKIGIHILFGAAAFIGARGVVAKRIMPFGLSFVAGSPWQYAPSAAIGAFLAYFFPAAGTSGFKYITAVLGVLALKLIFSNKSKISKNPVFAAFAAFCANLATGIAATMNTGYKLIDLIAETLLCAAGAYLVSKTYNALQHRSCGLSPDELCCLLLSFSLLLVGLNNLKIYSVSVGKIIAITLILTAARYGGTLAGTACGICAAFTSLLSSNPTESTFYLGGMAAGIFSGLGKYAETAAFTVCFIVNAAYGTTGNIAASFTEFIIGTGIFLLLPRTSGIVFSKLFSGVPQITVPSCAKKTAVIRLEKASGALKKVSDTVEQVSTELGRINSPDFNTLIREIELKACCGCKLRIHCWETKKDATLEAVLGVIGHIKERKDSDIMQSVPDEFKARCIKIKGTVSVIADKYAAFASKTAAENRIEEVRSVVSDQFEGISCMLRDLAEEISSEEKFDNAAALTAVSALKNINIRASSAAARIDRYGRMTIEMRIKKADDCIINKLQIMKTLSIVCERDFDAPEITEEDNEIFLSITEHAVYKIDLGVSQIAAAGGTMSGDAYNCFTDGCGKFIAILSDGMGTGGRAAVDGAMASGLMSRLLKAGFGYDCSLKILNSSMLFKSSDESLATVDIASIDLFTGETDIYKAGAAPTIVRRSGRCGRAESTSLPVGILHDVAFDRAGIRLKSGDVLLMLSDGASFDGTEWIRAELECYKDGSAKDLAEKIAESARRRRTDGHEDDITVIAAILEKAS